MNLCLHYADLTGKNNSVLQIGCFHSIRIRFKILAATDVNTYMRHAHNSVLELAAIHHRLITSCCLLWRFCQEWHLAAHHLTHVSPVDWCFVCQMDGKLKAFLTLQNMQSKVKFICKATRQFKVLWTIKTWCRDQLGNSSKQAWFKVSKVFQWLCSFLEVCSSGA